MYGRLMRKSRVSQWDQFRKEIFLNWSQCFDRMDVSRFNVNGNVGSGRPRSTYLVQIGNVHKNVVGMNEETDERGGGERCLSKA